MADLSFMSKFHNSDPVMVQSIVKKYGELDANRDGMLNFKECSELLRQGDDTMTDREIRSLFDSIDTSGTGRIDLTEFTSYIFEVQPEGSDRDKQIEEMRAKSREYEREVNQVEIFGASMCTELNGDYILETSRTLNGKPIFDRGYPQATIFYGFTEGHKQRGWFVAKKAPGEGKAVIRYKMFSPSPFAATPDKCAACWQGPAGRKDKKMVMQAADREEYDVGNKEGFGKSNEYFGNAEEEAQAEAEEEQAKFGETYEQDAGGGDEEGDWNSEWQNEAGEALIDNDDDNGVYEKDQAEGDSDDEANNEWTDASFPPEESSLGSKGGKESGAKGWARLSSLHDHACIFQVVTPEDVRGDQQESHKWFLSALACMAEYPAWVQSIFGQAKCTKLPVDHKYSVRLYHPGKKSFVRVEVDDHVPTRDGAPVFAGIDQMGEIWAPIIEKAFAKLCRSYHNAGWGSVAYGLLYLCGGGGAESWTRKQRGAWARSYTLWKGQANETIDRKRAEGFVTDGVEVGQATFWLTLQQYMELCYPVCLTADKVKAKKAGLRVDRAYSLISTQEVETQYGRIRLLRIRSPGQSGVWKGRWSDDSEAWVDCPAAFNACKFKVSDGKAFWMSFNDFMRYFDTVDCVKKSMPIQGCKYSKLDSFKDGLKKYGGGY